ncbi:MAG: GFA family protein [Pseudomonadota bacterium]
MNQPVLNGGCLCGQVRFKLHGKRREVVYCHCEQCRKISGHFVAATAVAPDDLDWENERGLRWFASSEDAERGFCQHCGSSLFWRPKHGGHISVMAGSIDGETGLKASEHIYLDSAGDYYELGDQLPQHRQRGPTV